MNRFQRIAFDESDAELLRRYRKQFGLTQFELADKSGVSRPTIEAIENKRVRLRGMKAARLWQALREAQMSQGKIPLIPALDR